MTSNHNLGGNYWGYLFEKDKSATSLLRQLCLGIAQIIVSLAFPRACLCDLHVRRQQGKLEPGPDAELTPQRLAAFYRSVGGNYDSLFLNNTGLSFMYSTLGCFHTLQPTSSPFEPPKIPALLPIGFVEWQRLQLLLCPGEHVPFMQEAVRRYDVPTPDGGIFPKYLPREAFPDRPDGDMEKWYKLVTGSLDHQYTTRLKNSPYASPRDPPHRLDGYFLSNGKLPQVRRPSRSPRSHSHDLDPARLSDDRRRSSVPDIPSPFPPVAENTYRGGDAQQFPPNSRTKQAQYNAVHRASNASSQHRTSDASSSRHRYSNSSHRTSNSSATYRPTLSSSAESSKQVPPSPHHTRHHQRPRSPSTINESSSGSEASSENSQVGRGRNSHEARDGRRRSSLFPPNALMHHLRRHSHDATYLPNGKPPLPPRPIGYSAQVQDPLLSARPGSGYQNGPTSGTVPFWNGNAVQFRNNPFDPRGDDSVNSAPESAVPVENLSPSKSPKLHSFDPMGSRELVRQYDTADLDQGKATQRKSGMPLRISTVTGVGGRKYAATGPRSAFAGSRLSPPQPLGMVDIGEGR